MATSRERVLKAISHQEPDRAPVDLGGHRSSGMIAIAYNLLKQHLGIAEGGLYVYDFIRQLATIEPSIQARFGVDTIELGRGVSLSPRDREDRTLPDGTPCRIQSFIKPVRVGEDWHVCHPDGTLIAIQKQGCLYFEQARTP